MGWRCSRKWSEVIKVYNTPGRIRRRITVKPFFKDPLFNEAKIYLTGHTNKMA